MFLKTIKKEKNLCFFWLKKKNKCNLSTEHVAMRTCVRIRMSPVTTLVCIATCPVSLYRSRTLKNKFVA